MQAKHLLIGLAGRAGAGKDTAADILCTLAPFHRFAFADPVRDEIVSAFGIDYSRFDVEHKERSTHMLAIGRCSDGRFIRRMVDLGQDVTLPRSPREIMRWWGTEYRRAQDPDYWTARAAASLLQAKSRGFDRIVITDVRFHNEVAAIHAWGGQVWRIDRAIASTRPADHKSESAINELAVNQVISNNRSVSDFVDEIAQAYRESIDRLQNVAQ